MSVRVMAMVWDSTVPAPERFTLLALADRADEDGVCWPSIPTLARKCRTGESTIRRHLKSLAVQRVVSSKQRMNASSVYRIDLAVLASLSDAEPLNPSQSDTPHQIGTPSDMGGETSQSGTTPPVRLSADPSQSERLSIIDPSGDPSLIHQGGRAKPRAAAQPKRGTRIPADFTVTPEMIAWARENTPNVGRVETEKFVDHFTAASGPNSVKRDWVAAWRNWMRREAERGNTGNGTQNGSARPQGTSSRRAQTFLDLRQADPA